MADLNSMSIEELEAELAGFSATPVLSSNFDLSSFGAGIGSAIPGVGSYLGSGLAEALNSTIGTSNLRQLGYDVPSGLFKGALSLPDLFVMGSNKLNSYLPYFKNLPQLQLASTPVDRLAETLGVEPNSTTQEIINFMTPLPGKKAEVAKDIALGGMGYLGSKLGQKVDEDSPYSSLIGGIALPLVSLGGYKAAALGGSGLKEAFNTGRAALGNEAMLREMAAQPLITAAGDAGMARIATAQKVLALLRSPMGARMTAGELTQSPAVASVQSRLEQDPIVGSIISNAREERRGITTEGKLLLGDIPAPGALPDAATAIAATESSAKSALEFRVAEKLGLTDEVRATTPLESAETLREYVTTLMAAGAEETRATWDLVPMGISVPIREPLTKGMRAYLKTGKLEQRSFSGDTKAVFAKAEEFLTGDGVKGLIDNPAGGKFDLTTANLGGTVTIHELQDLRRAAEQARYDARVAGKKSEARVLKVLIDDIDTGTDKLVEVWGDRPGIKELKTAIAATKKQKVKYESGFTELITAQKERGESRVLGSALIRGLTKSVEGIKELATKFGPNSVPMEEVKASLTKALNAATNPADFFAKNVDRYRAAFGKNVSTTVIEPYATSLATKVETPSVKFESEKEAAAFSKRFKDTEILRLARGDLLAALTSSPAGTGKRFAKLRTIARGLFGDDFPDVEKIVADIESAESVDILATQASRGQSPTGQRLLTQAFLSGQPGREARLKAFVGGGGSIIGGGLGAGPGASFGAALGGLVGGPIGMTIGGVTGGAIGGGIGYKFANRAAESLAEIDRLRAEMIVDPRLIPSAKTPVKKVPESVSRQIKRAAVLGERSLEDEQASPSSQDFNSMTVEELEKLLAEQPATKKDVSLLKDISIVSKAEAEDKSSSNEMVRLEKASKGFNVAKAIAGSSKMVQAVSSVESNLKHASISSRGAIGIMQLMPTTAEMLGVDPYDPRQNIKGGEKYLEQLRDRFKNDKLTFAAYNMGPTALGRAIRESGTRDWERIVKKLGVYNSKSNKKGIPAETIAYVPKVMKFYRR